MAKKKKPKKTVSKSVNAVGGSVTCSMGIKMSANYQSHDIPLGVDVKIGDHL
jgi:hypothetical protein